MHLGHHLQAPEDAVRRLLIVVNRVLTVHLLFRSFQNRQEQYGLSPAIFTEVDPDSSGGVDPRPSDVVNHVRAPEIGEHGDTKEVTKDAQELELPKGFARRT